MLSCIWARRGCICIWGDVEMMSLFGLHSSAWRVRCGMSSLERTFRLSCGCCYLRLLGNLLLYLLDLFVCEFCDE